MVFSCNYNTLVSNLQDIANIVEDPLAAEDDKSIIFMFTKSGVRLIGVSPVITFKRTLDESCYTLKVEDDELDENGTKLIMLKSKELLGFLNTYKSLRKTKVDELIFEPVQNKVKCTVIESLSFTKEELEKIQNDLAWSPDAHDPREERFHSSWMFTQVPIKPKKLPYINLSAPEVELESESGNGEFKLLSKSLIPIVENSSTVYGGMTFSENHIVAFNQAFTAIMCNVFPGGTFKGIKLSYRTLSFINKIISAEENVRYAKTERHIYFKTDSSEAFVVYDTKLTPYETQLSLFNPEHMISLDRGYLKDVLKRFSLVNDTIEVTVDASNDLVKMVNSKFSQEIPILDKKNFDEIGLFHFKIMPANLNNALIGEDNTFNKEGDEHNGETFVYYNKDRSIICLSDCTNIWFTVLAVAVY